MEPLYKQAIEAQNKQKYNEAEKIYRSILKIQPKHINANNNLGTLLYSLGRLDEAEVFYKKVIEIKPNVNGYNNLGTLQKVMNKLNEAEENIKKAIALKPNLAETYYNLALVQTQKGKLEEAEINYKRAIERKTNQSKFYNNLGDILFKLIKLEEAEVNYKKAIQLRPNQAEFYNNLGTTLLKLNRFDDAEANYRKAIELKPNLAEAYVYLGIVLMELGKLKESEISYRKAIELKPDYIEAHFNLSITHYFLNNLESSIFELEYVLKKDEDEFKFLSSVNLAIFKFLEDDYVESKKYLNLSTQIKKKLPADNRNNTFKAYYKFLIELLNYDDNQSLKANNSTHNKKLYVIGDSHTLVSHGLSIKKLNNSFLCKSKLIMGCKQWHLGNSSRNKYKFKFENIFCSLPKSSEVLLSIGEIDCRLDEGIIKYNRNYSKKNRKDLIVIIVENYLNYIYELNLLNQHKINIQGVPCPNIETKSASKEKVDELIELIKEFNTLLKKKSKEKGYSFLDLHKLTNRGDGFSNKIWHLDTHHLLPKGIEQAWSTHYIKN